MSSSKTLCLAGNSNAPRNNDGQQCSGASRSSSKSKNTVASAFLSAAKQAGGNLRKGLVTDEGEGVIVSRRAADGFVRAAVLQERAFEKIGVANPHNSEAAVRAAAEAAKEFTDRAADYAIIAAHRKLQAVAGRAPAQMTRVKFEN